MKRFVNNIPLGSITALIWGYTPIIIEDRKESNVYNDNAEDTRRWAGLVKDLYRANDEIKYKWMMAKVRQIRPTEDGFLFVISTQYEQY